MANDMETREIPRGEWQSFFEVFSRQHEGWLATLETFGQEIGAQAEPGELPLKSVTLTPVVGKSEAITISRGKAQDHVEHTVIEPTHVWLVQTPEGANAALEIEAADETKTLLRFRSPVLPELVDGVVLE
jgi:hypothetical protein